MPLTPTLRSWRLKNQTFRVIFGYIVEFEATLNYRRLTSKTNQQTNKQATTTQTSKDQGPRWGHSPLGGPYWESDLEYRTKGGTVTFG